VQGDLNGKTLLIYSISYFNLGGLELCLGGLSPPKLPFPVATGLNKETAETVSKDCFQ